MRSTRTGYQGRSWIDISPFSTLPPRSRAGYSYLHEEDLSEKFGELREKFTDLIAAITDLLRALFGPSSTPRPAHRS